MAGDHPSSARRIVLITGSNRSGTTWVGECLRRGLRRSLYLYEPFARRGINQCVRGSFPIKHHFHYVTADEYQEFTEYLDRMMSSSPYSLSKLTAQFGPKGVIKYAEIGLRRSIFNPDVLIKDALALFSTPFISQAFGAKPIILIRNPFAYVHSILRMKWRSNPSLYAEQTELLRDLLPADISREIRLFESTENNILEEAVLRWRIYHSAIRRFRADHPEWLYIRHEDLVQSPQMMFGSMADYLHIGVNSAMSDYIKRSTESDQELDLGSQHRLIRNARVELHRWAIELTPDQRNYIEDETAELVDEFYPDLLSGLGS